MAELHLKHGDGPNRDYETGAHRDGRSGKGRFDLIPSQLMFRLARVYEAGQDKYGPRNWEKGMPIGDFIDSALRHLEKYKDGWDDEDHLAQAVFNIAGIMFMERYLIDLQDQPAWEGRQSRWVVFPPDDAGCIR